MATAWESHKLSAAEYDPPTRARHGYRDADFAFTADEVQAVRVPSAAKVAPRSDGGASQRRRPADERFVYFDDNGEQLAVSFDHQSVLFTVEFRSATALLKLPDARHLARFLGGTIEHWRFDSALPYVAPHGARPR